MYNTIVAKPEELDIWTIGKKVCIQVVSKHFAVRPERIENNVSILEPKTVVNATYYGYLSGFSLLHNGLFMVYLRDRSEPLQLNFKNDTIAITYYEEIEEND